jgi:hypothetical protein
MTPKWIQKMIDRGVSPEVIEERIERRKIKDREWAELNKEKKAAHKRAYAARKKLKMNTANPFKLVSNDSVIKCTYRANWKEAPVYYCPELTYRGRQHD